MHLPSPRILLSGHSFPSDTEERQTKQLWYPHTDSPVICESIVRLRSHMHDALHRWNDFSDINTYLLSLDGLSGSGKSTLSQNISTTVSHMPGVSFYPVRVDGFIATARHSPLRLRMLESRELFWKLIYNRQSMIDMLIGIIQANGKACAVPVSHRYNRSTGSVGPAIVNIPAGRKIVVVDGIDSTRILQTLEKVAPCPQTRLLVLAPPNTALQRAATRDAKQGRRSVEEARMLRQKEFQYLVPQICGHNINNVDVIYAPEGFRAQIVRGSDCRRQ